MTSKRIVIEMLREQYSEALDDHRSGKTTTELMSGIREAIKKIEEVRR